MLSAVIIPKPGLRCRRVTVVVIAALAAVLGPVSTPGAQASPDPAATGVASGDAAPADFVVLSDVAPTVLREIRYHGHHNFIGRPIVGYREPLCLLTRDAAEALAEAQQMVSERGYTLKVYDCFRPQRSVDDFARWASRSGDERMKTEFYPRVDKSVLFDEGYIASRSGHSRGSTIDLTLVKLPATLQQPYVPGQPLESCYAPYGQRYPDNSVDMGTGYDCFDTLANTLDERITGEPRENRLLLKRTMEAAGFSNYPNEWWHYTLVGEPYPESYFDFPVARSSVG